MKPIDTTRINEAVALQARIRELEQALQPFIDDEICRLDHHGNCQIHSLGNPCEQIAARAALHVAGKAVKNG